MHSLMLSIFAILVVPTVSYNYIDNRTHVQVICYDIIVTYLLVIETRLS